MRKDLSELSLGSTDDITAFVVDYSSRARRALVEGHYVSVHILMLLFFLMTASCVRITDILPHSVRMLINSAV